MITWLLLLVLALRNHFINNSCTINFTQTTNCKWRGFLFPFYSVEKLGHLTSVPSVTLHRAVLFSLFHPFPCYQVGQESLSLDIFMFPSLTAPSKTLRSVCLLALLVLFAFTTNTPAPVISGRTGCSPSDGTVAPISLSRRSAFLKPQDSDWWHSSWKKSAGGQALICLQKIFIQEKKVCPLSVLKRKFRLVLPYVTEK